MFCYHLLFVFTKGKFKRSLILLLTSCDIHACEKNIEQKHRYLKHTSLQKFDNFLCRQYRYFMKEKERAIGRENQHVFSKRLHKLQPNYFSSYGFRINI